MIGIHCGMKGLRHSPILFQNGTEDDVRIGHKLHFKKRF